MTEMEPGFDFCLTDKSGNNCAILGLPNLAEGLNITFMKIFSTLKTV